MRSGVDAWRDAHDSFEVAGEMTLIGEANRGSHFHAVETIAEKMASALDAHVNLVGMWGQSKLLRKRSHEVKAAESRGLREFVECNQFIDAFFEDNPGAT